jgi:beta-lactam-binding protein with PASTA domain
MIVMQSVLGLPAQEAVARLEAASLGNVNVIVSGRRREGVARVIRQKQAEDRVELVVSHFKEIDSPSGGTQ